MRWFLAEYAKIVDGGDDAAAEEVVPDAVDHHARGQRVGGIDDLLGDFQAAAGGDCRRVKSFFEADHLESTR